MLTGRDTPPDPPWSRVPLRAGWADLVLSAGAMELLREIAVHVRRHRRVFDDWGFSRKTSHGRGVRALFSGPRGTGRTLAAEVLANELALDLYRIDLSSVVSKYIGETEENLARVFDAAEECGAILLFEEADALLGQRSEVKDSHDRCASIEISDLLQRLEAYRGLAILATNRRYALDEAFSRRVHYLVEFPFPDVAARCELWRRAFPPGIECHALDFDDLAQLELSGSTIRNIAQRASIQAATAAGPVTMPQILDATEAELRKLGRQRSTVGE